MNCATFSLLILISASTSTILKAHLLSQEDELEKNSNWSSRKIRETKTECAQSTDQDMFPWWRIELNEIMIIKSVQIRTDLSNDYKLHDIEIRVGNEDISQTDANTTFSGNKLMCHRLNGVLDKADVHHYCRARSYGGKYVSIQIVKPCMPPLQCPNNQGNTLKLCAVTIFGSKISKAESSDVGRIYLDGSASNGSSVAFGGLPEKALMRKIEIIRDPPSLCIEAGKTTSGSTSRTTTVHEIPLPETYVITDIFMSPEMDPSRNQNSTITIKISFRFSGVQNICAEKDKYVSSYDFKCDESVMGNIVNIDIVTFGPLKPKEQRDKALCKLQVWGYKAVNLAYRKVTRQSSAKDSSSSSIAVDATRTNSYEPDCTLTEANDEYPWWMVDLSREYVVKSVMIVGKNLGGIRIQVGNTDISDAPKHSIFTENLVCEDFSSYENAYKIPYHIKCGTALFGRYVSVQRATSCKTDPCFNSSVCESSQCNNVTFCSKEDCNTTIICSQKNPCGSSLLRLCEVEVFGIPVDVYYYGNAVNYDQTKITSNAKGRNLQYFGVEDQTYIWWLLEMGGDYFAVDKVELFTKETSNETIKFQLQVGLHYGPGDESKDWMGTSKPGQLCFQDDALQLTKKFYSFSCKTAIGRDIFLQYQYLDENISEVNQSLFFEFATAWVYKIKPLESAFDVESVKNLTGPATKSQEWIVAGESFSVEAYSNLLFYPFASEPRTECTYTLPGDPYPWWRIELQKIYSVTSFKVENWEDVKNRSLHDIEIRVGFSDIAKSLEKAPFASNSLCYATGSSKILPTSENLDCNKNSVGIYVSIQIVKGCTDAEICDIVEPNILQLCFVSFMGSELHGKNDNKISQPKSILQSSILNGADASQAFNNN